MKHLDVAVAIVFHDSKVLVARRKAGGVLGGYWEFPGGKCEPNETLEDCVRRELTEELAITVHPVVSFAPIQYQYPDRLVTLHPFLCTHDSGEPRLLGCDEIRWVEPQQLRSLKFPPANDKLIDQVIAALPAKTPSVEIPRRKKSARQSASISA
jgi:A/G-specific adenine glycosylase